MDSKLLTQLDALYRNTPRLLGSSISSLYRRGRSGHWQDVRSTSLALSALIESGERPNGEWLQAGARWLAQKQRPNGSWEDEVWDTAECVAALARCDSTKASTAKALSQAKKWLLEKQNDDGNWHEEPWETSLAILALMGIRTRDNEETLRKGMRWLLELQDKSTGKLVNHHYTALLAITLRSAILSNLFSYDEVGRHLLLAQAYLCNDLQTNEIWTEEVWSNSLCLSAIIPLELTDTANVTSCILALEWYDELLENNEWVDIDVEDTALAVIGFWNLMEYVLVSLSSSNPNYPLLVRELSRVQIEQQSRSLVRPLIHQPASPPGREFLFMEGDALVVPAFRRRLRIFSLMLAAITILTTLSSFWNQISGFLESLLGMLTW